MRSSSYGAPHSFCPSRLKHVSWRLICECAFPAHCAQHINFQLAKSFLRILKLGVVVAPLSALNQCNLPTQQCCTCLAASTLNASVHLRRGVL